MQGGRGAAGAEEGETFLAASGHVILKKKKKKTALDCPVMVNHIPLLRRMTSIICIGEEGDRFDSNESYLHATEERFQNYPWQY